MDGGLLGGTSLHLYSFGGLVPTAKWARDAEREAASRDSSGDRQRL